MYGIQQLNQYQPSRIPHARKRHHEEASQRVYRNENDSNQFPARKRLKLESTRIKPAAGNKPPKVLSVKKLTEQVQGFLYSKKYSGVNSSWENVNSRAEEALDSNLWINLGKQIQREIRQMKFQSEQRQLRKLQLSSHQILSRENSARIERILQPNEFYAAPKQDPMAARTLPSPSPSRATSPSSRPNLIDSNEFHTQSLDDETCSSTLNSAEDSERSAAESDCDIYGNQSESPDEEEIFIEIDQKNQQIRLNLDSKMLPAAPAAKRQPKKMKQFEAEQVRLAEQVRSAAGTSQKSAVKKVKKPKGKPKVRNYDFTKEGWVPVIRDLTLKMGKPPVWCKARQQLCEALPYFNSYQGGHYDKDGRARGYLLDGFPSPNDCTEQNGRVIISHGGGHSAIDPIKGYIMTSDGNRDEIRVHSLLNNLKFDWPVVLIAGVKFDPLKNYLQREGVRYAPLGFYKVTHVWAEAEPGENLEAEKKFFTRFKVRFEWLPAQGTPWFHGLIEDTSAAHGDEIAVAPTINSIECEECLQKFDQVYAQPIKCYNEHCKQFYSLNGQIPSPSQLTYSPAFLNLTPQSISSRWSNSVPTPFAPPSLQSVACKANSYEPKDWLGIYCENCGRLSSRSSWNSLDCDECLQSVQTKPKIFTVPELQKGPRMKSFINPADIENISVQIVNGPKLTGVKIVLGDDAIVWHLYPTETENTFAADEMFQLFQTAGAGYFKRNSLTHSRLSGETLTKHFSFNAGKHYDHVVRVSTYPFHDDPASLPNVTRAPECVSMAKNYLTKICRNFVHEPDQANFNEVLSVAYAIAPVHRMSYHDDGEKGLGPIVTSLSLGSDTDMLFRRKVRKNQKKIQSGSLQTSKHAGPLVRLHVRHGDIIIMEGHNCQADYEHMVEPKGLRFAATARFIGKDHKTWNEPLTARRITTIAPQ